MRISDWSSGVCSSDLPESDGFGFFRPLLQYWSERAAGRAAPRRSDIDPLDLPSSLLPHLLLIDVERDPPDFRYRLAGTAADTIRGQSLKGVPVSQLRPEAFEIGSASRRARAWTYE